MYGWWGRKMDARLMIWHSGEHIPIAEDNQSSLPDVPKVYVVNLSWHTVLYMFRIIRGIKVQCSWYRIVIRYDEEEEEEEAATQQQQQQRQRQQQRQQQQHQTQKQEQQPYITINIYIMHLNLSNCSLNLSHRVRVCRNKQSTSCRQFHTRTTWLFCPPYL